MERRPNPVTESIDGATGDITMSGDAMRWSPELAETPGRSSLGDLPALEAAAGIGSVLGLDAAGVRRLVSGALFSLTSAASDVVSELRSLARGSSAEDEPTS